MHVSQSVSHSLTHSLSYLLSNKHCGVSDEYIKIYPSDIFFLENLLFKLQPDLLCHIAHWNLIKIVSPWCEVSYYFVAFLSKFSKNMLNDKSKWLNECVNDWQLIFRGVRNFGNLILIFNFFLIFNLFLLILLSGFKKTKP